MKTIDDCVLRNCVWIPQMAISVSQIPVRTRGHVKTIVAPTPANVRLASLGGTVRLVSHSPVAGFKNVIKRN